MKGLKTKAMWMCLAAAIVGCSAEVKTKDGVQEMGGIPLPSAPVFSSKPFTGEWTGKGRAEVQGGSQTECTVNYKLEQTADHLIIRSVNLACDNDMEIDMDKAVELLARSGTDPDIQAKDLVYKDSVVGWLGNDNTAYWVDFSESGFSFIHSVRNVPEGLSLSLTLLDSNRYVIVDLKDVALTAK